MSEFVRFNTLTDEGKTSFFQRCQDLLVKNQPDSEFVLSRGMINKNYFLDLYLKYKGFAYSSANVALLINKKKYNSLGEAQAMYFKNLYSEPDEDANCYTIDFISAVMNPNLIEELRPFFDENLENIAWLRSGRVSFFKFESYKKIILQRFK